MMTEPLLTNTYRAGRKTGFSLHESLVSQGVTSTEAMRKHKGLALQALQSIPDYDVLRYRVDSNNPNMLPTTA